MKFKVKNVFFDTHARSVAKKYRAKESVFQPSARTQSDNQKCLVYISHKYQKVWFKQMRS